MVANMNPDDFAADMVAGWRETALRAMGKEVDELTEDEKFAIGFCAGVHLHLTTDESGKPTWRTEDMGITKIDGKFRVFTYANAKPLPRITIPIYEK